MRFFHECSAAALCAGLAGSSRPQPRKREVQFVEERAFGTLGADGI
jgi:hypothetical protein